MCHCCLILQIAHELSRYLLSIFVRCRYEVHQHEDSLSDISMGAPSALRPSKDSRATLQFHFMPFSPWIIIASSIRRTDFHWALPQHGDPHDVVYHKLLAS